jgi:hypothetical protein
MKNKTMDKIVKLELPIAPLSPFQLGYQDKSGKKIMMWEIAEKLNEVIDTLNQLQGGYITVEQLLKQKKIHKKILEDNPELGYEVKIKKD